MQRWHDEPKRSKDFDRRGPGITSNVKAKIPGQVCPSHPNYVVIPLLDWSPSPMTRNSPTTCGLSWSVVNQEGYPIELLSPPVKISPTDFDCLKMTKDSLGLADSRTTDWNNQPSPHTRMPVKGISVRIEQLTQLLSPIRWKAIPFMTGTSKVTRDQHTEAAQSDDSGIGPIHSRDPIPKA